MENGLEDEKDQTQKGQFVDNCIIQREVDEDLLGKNSKDG